MSLLNARKSKFLYNGQWRFSQRLQGLRKLYINLNYNQHFINFCYSRLENRDGKIYPGKLFSAISLKIFLEKISKLLYKIHFYASFFIMIKRGSFLKFSFYWNESLSDPIKGINCFIYITWKNIKCYLP